MTTALAIIAIIVSLAAFAVALWQGHSNRRAATAAEDAAVTSRQAADYAREALDVAKQGGAVELDREHDRFAPKLSDGQWHVDEQPLDPADWKDLYTFRVSRPFLIHAYGVWPDGTKRQLAVTPDRIGYDTPVSIVATLDSATELPVSIELLFWPPIPKGPGQWWQCRCGRSLSPEDGKGSGHWHRVVKVPDELRLG
ncbi:MAG TPA: hypothetical protein VI172_14720 [Candidatus Dormibacteraeota bacterium]|jgi:type II secretory pathway pseudopilin PulG